MPVNSINLAQNLVTSNRNAHSNIAFKGEAPDLEALKAKQDEFRRMSEQVGEQGGFIGKLGKFGSKAIGILVAFTATKICLGKAADLISGTVGKYTNSATQKAIEALNKKAAEKTGEEAAKLAEKATKLAEKFEKSKVLTDKIQKVVVNTIAGGAAIGVAMKDFGLVKKQVSDNTENLVDQAVDNATGNGYNTSGSGSNDFNVSEDDF